eukprot:1615055-Pyramimonas_sp.AAC.1
MLGVGRTLWKTEPVASEISSPEKAFRPRGSGGACGRRPHRTACAWSASGTSKPRVTAALALRLRPTEQVRLRSLAASRSARGSRKKARRKVRGDNW